MPNKPGYSTTASATPMHKICANQACGRVFETREYSRDYCTLKCKDYAARRRRRLKEAMEHEGHDPRLGSQTKEIEADQRAAVLRVVNDPKSTIDYEVKFLYDAVLAGKTELMNAPHISAEVKQRVNKMLLERAAAGDNDKGQAVAAPTGSYIVSDTESTLRDLGLLSKDAPPTEQVFEEPEQPKTDAEKASEL